MIHLHNLNNLRLLKNTLSILTSISFLWLSSCNVLCFNVCATPTSAHLFTYLDSMIVLAFISWTWSFKYAIISFRFCNSLSLSLWISDNDLFSSFICWRPLCSLKEKEMQGSFKDKHQSYVKQLRCKNIAAYTIPGQPWAMDIRSNISF